MMPKLILVRAKQANIDNCMKSPISLFLDIGDTSDARRRLPFMRPIIACTCNYPVMPNRNGDNSHGSNGVI